MQGLSERAPAAADERLLVVSVDSHVSPPIAAYRDYCDPSIRDDYERFVAEIDARLLTLGDIREPGQDRPELLARMDREYGRDELNADPSLRLSHMDSDGVVAEVIFHGGFNMQPIPFFSPKLSSTFSQDVPETADLQRLRRAGIRMYNRWLADFVAHAPGRFIGLAHIPMWDIDATLEEIRFAHASGLEGINLPSPRRHLQSYNLTHWDAVWAVCTELGMSLHTHGGGGELYPVAGPGAIGIHFAEVCFAGRRGLWQLIFGGVFERFPELVFFLTEQSGGWVVDALQTMDSGYLAPVQELEAPCIRDVLPRRPSEYFHSNCFIGGSFMARMEAAAAIDHGYWTNVAWGRDYPHPEGTWPYTRESIATTMAGLPDEPLTAMFGETALRVLHLDEPRLRRLAANIGPRWSELRAPGPRPAGSDLSFGFRTVGSFA
jgi:predicted TIM-barrel fold metal-dependent hydrolase